MKAHRVAWILTNGPIPDGVWVLHHCDNRICVRPDHLYLGDNIANVRDKVVRHRACGDKAPVHKLSSPEVLLIRQAQGTKSSYKVARDFGVSPATVQYIWTRRRWNHVP